MLSHLEPRAAPLVRHFHVDAGSVGAGIPRAKEQGHLTAEHDPIGAHLTERPDEEPPPRWPPDRLRCRHRCAEGLASPVPVSEGCDSTFEGLGPSSESRYSLPEATR